MKITFVGIIMIGFFFFVPHAVAATIPAETSIVMSLKMHGIGNGGDSANPHGQGTFTPAHPTRSVTIEFDDAQGKIVSTKEETVQFNSDTGLFGGTISLANTLPAGEYTIKIKTKKFLQTTVPSMQTIATSSANVLPVTSMVAGDITGDNKIDVMDLNILLGCFSDLTPAASCSPEAKEASDITDDNEVNQFDYNLFLRELNNQPEK